MSRQINNLRLNLDSIICISKISSKTFGQSNESQGLFEEAFDVSTIFINKKVCETIG